MSFSKTNNRDGGYSPAEQEVIKSFADDARVFGFGQVYVPKIRLGEGAQIRTIVGPHKFAELALTTVLEKDADSKSKIPQPKDAVEEAMLKLNPVTQSVEVDPKLVIFSGDIIRLLDPAVQQLREEYGHSYVPKPNLFHYAYSQVTGGEIDLYSNNLNVMLAPNSAPIACYGVPVLDLGQFSTSRQ